MLRLLDLTLSTPAENLALDEALLFECDRGAGETLRFWESGTYFVALGVSSRREADADVGVCSLDGVPILRRASGGGTVLQGPGCLNYALALRLEARPELRDVTRGYAAILGRVAEALGLEGIAQQGTSDLAQAGWKLSGSAQKRTRNALLHHGTLLHAFDLDRIPRYLREPEKQPEYRTRRRHLEFVRNMDLSAGEIRHRLARAWDAVESVPPFPLPDLARLLRERYANPEWHGRF